MKQSNRHPIIQWFYQKQYAPLLDELRVGAGTRVLDIGFGTGFLKTLVHARGAAYLGIEADEAAYESAAALYGREGYIQGRFPQEAPAGRADIIFVLSCLDEVPEKAGFIAGMKSRLEPGHGVAGVAVRNRAFFVNRFKTERIMVGRSERARIKDLSAEEWEKLFITSGLHIATRKKFLRPWLTGFTFTSLKNLVYRLISMVVPCAQSYMLYYLVKVD
jgi:SAM-dependent methyltransferase